MYLQIIDKEISVNYYINKQPFLFIIQNSHSGFITDEVQSFCEWIPIHTHGINSHVRIAILIWHFFKRYHAKIRRIRRHCFSDHNKADHCGYVRNIKEERHYVTSRKGTADLPCSLSAFRLTGFFFQMHQLRRYSAAGKVYQNRPVYEWLLYPHAYACDLWGPSIISILR